MKDGLICGLVLGMVAGALLYKYNPQAKEFVNKTEDAVKNEMDKMNSQNKASKKSN